MCTVFDVYIWLSCALELNMALLSLSGMLLPTPSVMHSLSWLQVVTRAHIFSVTPFPFIVTLAFFLFFFYTVLSFWLLLTFKQSFIFKMLACVVKILCSF